MTNRKMIVSSDQMLYKFIRILMEKDDSFYLSKFCDKCLIDHNSICNIDETGDCLYSDYEFFLMWLDDDYKEWEAFF